MLVLSGGLWWFWKRESIRKRALWNRSLKLHCTHCIGIWRKLHLHFTIFFLAKILRNSAKFLQKMTPSFKNPMRNLDNFRKAVESLKTWNSMSYFCPKITFLQLKHYIQWIFLTLLSTTFVKIHQTFYVIFRTISHFSQHNCSAFFSSNITYFLQS